MKHTSMLRLAWRSIPPPLQNLLRPYFLPVVAGFIRQAGYGFVDFSGMLEHIKANGFYPNTIIDVGAFVGDWTRTASHVFPEARCLMVEGNEENREHLAAVSSETPNSQYVIALLGAKQETEVIFHVNSQGSSILPELTSFARQKRVLPLIRLDDLMAGRRTEDPILLKVDVQGFELEVLRGAPATLSNSEIVILETSLMYYNLMLRSSPKQEQFVVS